MRTLHEAVEAVETFSPAEERFNRRRRTAGLFLAPAIFLILLFAPLGDIPVAAHRMAAVMGLVVTLWLTEALPLAVTAMLGPCLAVVLGVATGRQALAPFADPIIFLFIGGFMLAQAMFVHGVDRRIAYTALAIRGVGHSAFRILLVYGAVCTSLSMWISNTATTAMMFPIGLSIIAHLGRTAPKSQQAAVRKFALAMMLITSFGPSIGGIGTPVGTPPNLIGIGMLEKIVGERISFFSWMALGVPIVVVLFGYLLLQFYLTSVRGLNVADGSTALVHEELKRLGPTTAGQRNVLIAFGITVALWIAPGAFAILQIDQTPFARAYSTAMPESVAAMFGAFLLFILPIDWRERRFTLTWDEAVKIDWGITLLYGGGLALGEMTFSTGLAQAMGEGITSWLPSQSTLALTVLFTGAAIVVSEAASNTASANMVIPIAIAVSQAAGVRAIEPVLGATLGASMGFMMPVSTAPNAIVYSSGFVPIGQMMRHGVMLDIVAFFVIITTVMLLGPMLF
ncbi:MAG: DASS family sodium-coupled anion symporter [Acidobacteriota bacterium]|nr:DASS family sodium-coupled anion symporter [Acidobacteriota bacterium]